MRSYIRGEGADLVIPEADISRLEPPETPAPVFAVRAFKHALFGTPKSAENDPDIAPTEDEMKSEQPARANATSSPEKRATSAEVLEAKNFGSSPVKPASILMTPGTGATRRKTVSFRAQVATNEARKSLKQSRSGLPNDFPGKFPSPWTPKTVEKHAEQQNHTEQARATKLTRSLYDVRESSRSGAESQGIGEGDHTTEFDQPKSKSGQYWKQEYEQYTVNTKQEMKKLVTKQRLAKSYARQKDSEVTELAGMLRDERRKTQKLQARTSELEAQMQEYQNALTQTKEELALSRQYANEKIVEARNHSNEQDSAEWQVQQRRTSRELREAREESSTLRIERDNLRKQLDEARLGARDRRARNRADNDGSQAPLDIWADAIGGTPASAESVKTIIKSSPAKQPHPRTETSPMVAQDLDSKYKTPPKQISPPYKPQFPPTQDIESTKQQNTKRSPRYRKSIDSSLSLPQPSPEPSALIQQTELKDSIVDMPPSSPFPNDAMAVPIRSSFPNANTTTQPIGKPPRKNSVVSKKETKKENINPHVSGRANNKHNVNADADGHSANDNLQVPAIRPSTQTKTSTKENAVPQNTLARASPGAPSAEGGERRTSSLVTRQGRAVSDEKFAEAQKRIEERKKARQMDTSRPMSFR